MIVNKYQGCNAVTRLVDAGLALRQRDRNVKYRSHIDRWELVVGWDILGLDVRAHSKPKLVHFVLALQASGRRDGDGISDGEA